MPGTGRIRVRLAAPLKPLGGIHAHPRSGTTVRFHEKTGSVQGVIQAGRLARPQTQAQLTALNAEGYDLYCTVNTVTANARSRTKADIAEVRRLQLDLDDNGREGLRKLRRSGMSHA